MRGDAVDRNRAEPWTVPLPPDEPLLSHPHLRLGQHVGQVLAAARHILGRHSAGLRPLWPVLEASVRLHDLGKGSAAFQRYIRNPGGYRGPKEEKAHATLSMVLGMLLLQAGRLPALGARVWPWPPELSSLLLAIAVGGHHRGLCSREALGGWFLNDRSCAVLRRQMPTLQLERLGAETGLDLGGLAAGARPWLDAEETVADAWDALDELLGLDQSAALRFRLHVQFVFACLLEADKAFLAVAEPRRYLRSARPSLPAGLVERLLGQVPPAPLSELREQARREALAAIGAAPEQRLWTLTLPTGLGKTLCAASWALALRERLAAEGAVPPRLVLALPFLSIIDQTQQVWRGLLRPLGRVSGEVLLESHSLADRRYEDSELDEGSAEFFVDTWRSEVVVTTFDQLLMALMDPRTKHQMRFHNLVDALIVLDEVQSLPVILWDPLGRLLEQLAQLGSTRVLLMSATQPAILTGVRELVSEPERYFRRFGRYRLVLRHTELLPLEDFARQCAEQAPQWLREGRRVLITLNTRRSARRVRDEIERAVGQPPELLSADVRPRDRLRAIGRIRRGAACIAVSTQCVEAGVDIDMDLVLRDFAPLDSLVQIAGRCNRNGRRPRCEVVVVRLASERGRPFGDYVYDPIHLQETFEALRGRSDVEEEQVHELCAAYFAALRRKMDVGQQVTKSLASWRELPDTARLRTVRELLRGEVRDKVDFLIVERGCGLARRLRACLRIEDRWARRRALRRLAPQIQSRTVSVYARDAPRPADVARALGPLWLLRRKFYSPRRGILLPDAGAEPESLQIF
jgi:CRISPR-associated endonuclease/helicase Cas3